MIPSILMLGIGSRRRVLLPIPALLLWPLVGLAWIAVGLGNAIAWVLRAPADGFRRARFLLGMLNQLSGTVVDIEPSDGSRIYIRMI